MKTRVQCRMTSYQTVDRQNGIVASFCQSFFGCTLLIVNLSPSLLIYHRSLRCTIAFTKQRCHILGLKFGTLSLTRYLVACSIMDTISACVQRTTSSSGKSYASLRVAVVFATVPLDISNISQLTSSHVGNLFTEALA